MEYLSSGIIDGKVGKSFKCQVGGRSGRRGMTKILQTLEKYPTPSILGKSSWITQDFFANGNLTANRKNW